MLDSLFKNKFSYTYDYFNSLLGSVFENKRKFPQALIFEGTDTKTQYLFALELARILNCQKDRTKDCDCINCKWIKSYSHPAVNNVSEIHFKPDDDESKHVISVKQAKEIEKTISLSSDYYRFFIFFSSEQKECDSSEMQDFASLGYGENIDFSIKPLEYKTFSVTTLNALLKSIEEPSENVVFVFLTKSREDILPTIVSRCLTFKLSGKKEQIKYDNISNFLSNYFNLNYTSALQVSEIFQSYIKENNLSLEYVLNQILEYLKDVMKQNLENNELVAKIQNDILIVNTAIKHSKASMHDKIVLDNMFLKIVRGY